MLHHPSRHYARHWLTILNTRRYPKSLSIRSTTGNVSSDVGRGSWLLMLRSSLSTTTSSTNHTKDRGSVRAANIASFKVMDVLRRANELQDAGHHILHCEIGQPSTGAPQSVKQAAIKALQDPTQIMGYTDAFGILPLREKIIQQYHTNYTFHDPAVSLNDDNIKIPTTAQVIITTGSSAGFLLAFYAAFDVDDVVAIASVGYPCYRNILETVGCTLVHVPVNDEFKLTAHELQQEIHRRNINHLPPIKGLILSSPSNPTGSMLSPIELQELCQLCDRHHIQFVSDEIYHGISYGKPTVTALQYSKNVIVINSFSKYYSSMYTFVLFCFFFVLCHGLALLFIFLLLMLLDRTHEPDRVVAL
jgi:aspartate/methionine/tyrosine aminotransferase